MKADRCPIGRLPLPIASMAGVRRASAIVLMVVGAASGCAAGTAHAVPLPPAPASITVTMLEYRFDNPSSLGPGRALIHVANGGSLPHKLEMVRLPAGFQGTLDHQLHSSTRLAVATLASLPTLQPGGRQVFAVDLVRGQYGFLCFTKDPNGTIEALEGMSSEFRVT